MRKIWTIWTLAVLAVAHPSTARADATVFVGATTTPANRAVKGLALGVGFLAIGVEFEYASTSKDDRASAPDLRTGSGNVLLQSPVPIFGLQPYITAGMSLYRERLGARSHTAFAPNTGGGVKVSLAGPLHLRVDYRVFKLGRDALYSPAHRVYAGLNLKF
jgi:opacity protein-like surface antigen